MEKGGGEHELHIKRGNLNGGLKNVREGGSWHHGEHHERDFFAWNLKRDKLLIDNSVSLTNLFQQCILSSDIWPRNWISIIIFSKKVPYKCKEFMSLTQYPPPSPSLLGGDSDFEIFLDWGREKISPSWGWKMCIAGDIFPWRR